MGICMADEKTLKGEKGEQFIFRRLCYLKCGVTLICDRIVAQIGKKFKKRI